MKTILKADTASSGDLGGALALLVLSKPFTLEKPLSFDLETPFSFDSVRSATQCRYVVINVVVMPLRP
jgi:hypothetical protein